MVLQSRVFWREIDAGNIGVAIEAVRTEVNAFLATKAPGLVRAVDTNLTPDRKYGEGTIYMVTVIYLE